MKKIIILILSLAFASTIFGAEDKAPKQNSSDAFLTFVLDKAKTYADKAETAVSKAVDFTLEQTPILAQEFLRWRAWKHGANAAGALALVVFFAALSFFSFSEKMVDASGGMSIMLGIVGLTVAFAVFILGFWPELMSFIQIQVSPKIYLIEQAAKMFK